jgi:hypothetical protein
MVKVALTGHLDEAANRFIYSLSFMVALFYLHQLDVKSQVFAG